MAFMTFGEKLHGELSRKAEALSMPACAVKGLKRPRATWLTAGNPSSGPPSEERQWASPCERQGYPELRSEYRPGLQSELSMLFGQLAPETSLKAVCFFVEGRHLV